jgi:quercetin dioxygenase-like cupin family protein
MDMTLPSFDEFTAQALSNGFSEVLVREWKPNQVVELHQHDFKVSALVVQGQFTLNIDGVSKQLQVGDRFEVSKFQEHAEYYGPEGATFWAARDYS